ncbi:MAG: hypothetical protein K2M97_02240, partial [Muribaculaceae bacterium]|nr:hypothetical protein [Muribaculaceae bacterium]
ENKNKINALNVIMSSNRIYVIGIYIWRIVKILWLSDLWRKVNEKLRFIRFSQGKTEIRDDSGG